MAEKSKRYTKVDHGRGEKWTGGFKKKKHGGDEWMKLRIGERCACVVKMKGREVGTATGGEKIHGGESG